jgi:predicted nucleic acid-binding Zn ribbon protein
MPGASQQTQPVKILNANWVAGQDGDHGRFEIMLITDDEQQHVAAPSPEALVALLGLVQADTVLLWDPSNRTLIAANVVGRMPWTEHIHPDAAAQSGREDGPVD